MEPAPAHLLHVGYAKAGATFFKAWCASREDVAFCHGGIAGFRSAEAIVDEPGAPPRLRVTSSEALAWGAGPARGRAQLHEGLAALREGEPLPPLADHAGRQARTCRTLAGLFPTAHVLILIRGYDTALRSGTAQWVKRGVAAFDPADPAARQRALDYYARILDYDRVVAMYEAAFGQSRVSVLPYELLRDDAQAFVRALCKVGGLPHRPFDPGRVNASPPPHALGLVNRVTPAVHAVAARVPRPLADGLLRTYGRALTRALRGAAVDRLARTVGATPFPDPIFSADELHVAFAGRADAVARRPAVAPYAEHYLVRP